MLRQTISKTRQWIGVNVLGHSPVRYWSQMEIRRRITELQKAKDDLKDEMDEKKAAFDEKIEEAKTADESRVQEIESEASLLLKEFKAAESQWAEVLNGLRFMQQAALGTRVGRRVPDAMPTGMTPSQFQATARGIKDNLENREDKRLRMQAANEEMEETWDTGGQVESLADDRVKSAIEAARSGSETPTLDELAEDDFSREDGNTESGAAAPADGPEMF
ncbi:hypothetical protein [Haloarcula amylolytica]|uniref:hypothetical protein n=1 Tax=Haloarcula amylolytica TaxID=396317 RepID=UPI003C755EC8